MTRRLALLLPALLCADDRTEVLEAVEPLASALRDGDANGFLSRIAEEAPNRSLLADYLQSLVALAEITCSIQLKRYESSRAELDWYMEIRGRASQAVIERRKASVFLRFRDRRIISLEPVDFFKPPAVR